MTRNLPELDALTEKVIGCAIEVHRTLGPGLLESVYRECMILEMLGQHLSVQSERQVPLEYKGQRIKGQLKLDLLVEGCVVVELKAVDQLHPVHLAQVITYLKLTGYPAGLLMNFNSTTLRAGLKTPGPPGHVREEDFLIASDARSTCTYQKTPDLLASCEALWLGTDGIT